MQTSRFQHIQNNQEKARCHHTIFPTTINGFELSEARLTELFEKLWETKTFTFLFASIHECQGRDPTIIGSHVHVMSQRANVCTVSSIKKLFKSIMTDRPMIVRPKGSKQTFEVLYNYVDKYVSIFKAGDKPRDPFEKVMTKGTNASEKQKDIFRLAKAQKWDELMDTYPLEFVRQGMQLKALFKLQTLYDESGFEQDEHLWIYGPPGLGKTAIVDYLWPKHYRMDATSPYFQQYQPDQEEHQVVHIEEMDHMSFKQIGRKLKEFCDPKGFNYSVKYGGGSMGRAKRVVITSNYNIRECLDTSVRGNDQLYSALTRVGRYRQVHISDFLVEHGLQLVSQQDRERLRREGNQCAAKLFEPISIPKCVYDNPKLAVSFLLSEDAIDTE